MVMSAGSMGRIYGDSLKNPAAVAALLGDFCFLAGIPKEELISPKLILECLKQGWYPSRDAHNLGSVALAEKLGYHLDHEYEAYEVMREHA